MSSLHVRIHYEMGLFLAFVAWTLLSYNRKTGIKFIISTLLFTGYYYQLLMGHNQDCIYDHRQKDFMSFIVIGFLFSTIAYFDNYIGLNVSYSKFFIARTYY